MESSFRDLFSIGANYKVRKLLACSYLRDFRIREAVEVYYAILRETPTDIDVLLALGYLYQVAGSVRTAKMIYDRVIELEPAISPVALPVTTIAGNQDAAWIEEDYAGQEALTRLAQRLTMGSTEETLEKLHLLADKIETTPSRLPAQEALIPYPEDLQHLMSVLVEMNIRQAQAEGHFDEVGDLQLLRNNLFWQAERNLPEDPPAWDLPSNDPVG